MNIVINTQCNAMCPYCFAKNLKGDNLLEMDIDTFRRALRFFHKSGDEKVKILGGEPTLHSKFKELVIEVLKIHNPANIQIFTNGFVESSLIRFLSTKDLKFVLNYSARKFSAGDKNRIREFLDILGKQTVLGINIDQDLPNKEISNIVYIINKYKMQRTLRVGITSPTYNFSNTYANLEKDKLALNAAIRNIGKSCADNYINLFLDCSVFPLCFIEKETLLSLKKFNGVDIRTLCKPTLDVLPNGNVARCYALSNLQEPLNIFKDKNELMSYFKKIDESMLSTIPERCQGCIFDAGTCQGGCLSFRYSYLAKRKP